MAKVFAYGDDQPAFPNLFLVHDVVTDAAVLRDAPGNESRDNQRNAPARRREPSRLEPRLPPTSWLFRQPWCNFLPDLPPVICSGSGTGSVSSAASTASIRS